MSDDHKEIYRDATDLAFQNCWIYHISEINIMQQFVFGGPVFGMLLVKCPMLEYLIHKQVYFFSTF